mmetsp:Transcript_92474/g.285510  ORF Transcript_92474/g.285510 Transcript_92474/m.285510 type:complete len:248 (-) Transcript_92474:384-1127(-)
MPVKLDDHLVVEPLPLVGFGLQLSPRTGRLILLPEQETDLLLEGRHLAPLRRQVRLERLCLGLHLQDSGGLPPALAHDALELGDRRVLALLLAELLLQCLERPTLAVQAPPELRSLGAECCGLALAGGNAKLQLAAPHLSRIVGASHLQGDPQQRLRAALLPRPPVGEVQQVLLVPQGLRSQALGVALRLLQAPPQVQHLLFALAVRPLPPFGGQIIALTPRLLKLLFQKCAPSPGFGKILNVLLVG